MAWVTGDGLLNTIKAAAAKLEEEQRAKQAAATMSVTALPNVPAGAELTTPSSIAPSYNPSANVAPAIPAATAAAPVDKATAALQAKASAPLTQTDLTNSLLAKLGVPIQQKPTFAEQVPNALANIPAAPGGRSLLDVLTDKANTYKPSLQGVSSVTSQLPAPEQKPTLQDLLRQQTQTPGNGVLGNALTNLGDLFDARRYSERLSEGLTGNKVDVFTPAWEKLVTPAVSSIPGIGAMLPATDLASQFLGTPSSTDIAAGVLSPGGLLTSGLFGAMGAGGGTGFARSFGREILGDVAGEAVGQTLTDKVGVGGALGAALVPLLSSSAAAGAAEGLVRNSDTAARAAKNAISGDILLPDGTKVPSSEFGGGIFGSEPSRFKPNEPGLQPPAFARDLLGEPNTRVMPETALDVIRQSPAVQKLEQVITAAKKWGPEFKEQTSARRSAVAGQLAEAQRNNAPFDVQERIRGQLDAVERPPHDIAFTKQDVDDLMRVINTAGGVGVQPFDRMNAMDVLTQIARNEMPTPGDINRLKPVLGDVIVKELLDVRSGSRKAWDNFADATGLPRAIKSSFDLSGPMRQGAPFITRPEWWKAQPAMVRAFADEKFATDLMDQMTGGRKTRLLAAAGDEQAIADVARADYAQARGLDLTGFGTATPLSKLEESFATRLARKIPGVAASEQAYVTFLNKLRYDVFNNWVDGRGGHWEDKAAQLGTTVKQLEADAAAKNAIAPTVPVAGRFNPGERVKTLDRSNIGTVVKDEGGSTIFVHWRSPEGAEEQKWMPRNVVETLDRPNAKIGAKDLSQRDPILIARDREAEQMAKWINIATGRGSIPDNKYVQAAMVFGNRLMWSPRLTVSRFQMPLQLIDPRYTMAVRGQIARDLVGWAGLNATALGLLSLRGIGDVSLDPLSSDFGQLKVGNQRFDPWGGERPVAVFLSRMLADFNEDPHLNWDKAELALRFGRSKLDPGLPALVVDLWTGTTFLGSEFSPKDLLGTGQGSLSDRFVPLAPRDIYDAWRLDNASAPAAALGLLGLGTNTYESSEDARRRIAEDNLLNENLAGDRRIINDLMKGEGLLPEQQPVSAEAAFGVMNSPELLAPAQERLITQIRSGASPQAKADAIRQFKHDVFVIPDALRSLPSVQQYFEEHKNDAGIWDQMAAAYWGADAPIDPATGIPDYDKRDALRRQVEIAARVLGGQKLLDYITGDGPDSFRKQKVFDPEVMKALADYEDAVSKTQGLADAPDKFAYLSEHPEVYKAANDNGLWTHTVQAFDNFKEAKTQQGIIDSEFFNSNREKWRELTNDLSDQYYARQDGIFADITASVPETTIDAYFAFVDSTKDTVFGDVDWKAVEEWKVANLTPEEIAAIDNREKKYLSPQVQEYRAAQTYIADSGYWDAGNRTMKSWLNQHPELGYSGEDFVASGKEYTDVKQDVWSQVYQRQLERGYSDAEANATADVVTGKLFSSFDSGLSNVRKAYRAADPKLNELLIAWDYRDPGQKETAELLAE